MFAKVLRLRQMGVLIKGPLPPDADWASGILETTATQHRGSSGSRRLVLRHAMASPDMGLIFALAPLLTQWPQLRLSLLIDDAMIDLIEARIDIAIRVGRMPDSQWVTRSLGALEVALCATPAYLERNGLPDVPSALEKHQMLAFVGEAKASGATSAQLPEPPLPTMSLEFRHPKLEMQRIDLGVRIVSNNRSALQQMCEQGLGLARLAVADVQLALARGTLVQLLPQWQLPLLPVTAITPQREGEPAKVREAVASMQRYFAQLPGMVT